MTFCGPYTFSQTLKTQEVLALWLSGASAGESSPLPACPHPRRTGALFTVSQGDVNIMVFTGQGGGACPIISRCHVVRPGLGTEGSVKLLRKGEQADNVSGRYSPAGEADVSIWAL